jgi:TRAP-type C4-dicarboxylate transport system permease small subunit
MIRRTLDALYIGAGYLAGGFLVVIFLIMMFMSVGRSFGLNIPSGDDIASWCMAAMAFLGLAHTFKRGEMIRVALLLENLPRGARHGMEIFCLVVGLGFTSFFTWHAFRYVMFSYTMNDVSTGVLVVPMWIPQLGFLAGIGLLTIAMADELVHVLRGNRPTFEKEPPKTAEEVVARAAEGGGV